MNNVFHIVTPLIESRYLSDLLEDSNDDSRKIFLKLENIQPSGSFKLRGIGNHIAKKVHLNTLFDFKN